MLTTAAAPRPATALSPYSEPWTWETARHLLLRASFAPAPAEIDTALSLGLEGTIDRLLSGPPLPAPLNYRLEDHPYYGMGESWAGKPLVRERLQEDNQTRANSLRAWLVLQMLESGLSARPKMLLFWHNHFSSNGGSADVRYDYLKKCGEYAFGNARELVKAVTVDASMLIFLDGVRNLARNPNENFAREVLELYTVGKGQQVADGDYTNYTEQDVTELAKAFTGWRIRYNANTNPVQLPQVYFDSRHHDKTTKRLSHRFDSAEIANGEENEYATVIDLLFGREATALHLCRKLYRHFVYFRIDAAVEREVIVPLARLMIESDYQVAPVLRALFSSEHFYRPEFRGAMIKTPLDYMVGIYRPLGLLDGVDPIGTYYLARRMESFCNQLDMVPHSPPSVAGWPAYYQEPNFHRLWLGSATLQRRVTLFRGISRNGLRLNEVLYRADWPAVVADFPDPYDLAAVVDEMGRRLLAVDLLPAQANDIVALVLNGQEDFVWTNEFSDYMSNPNDNRIVNALRRRILSIVYSIGELAEYQLM